MLIVCMAMLLAGCSGTEAGITQEPKSIETNSALDSNTNYNSVGTTSYGSFNDTQINFSDIANLEDYFTKREVRTNETEQVFNLVLSDASDDEFAISGEKLTISENSNVRLQFVASWYHHGEVLYLGVINEQMTIAYSLSLSGGAAYGEIDLSNIPAGNYSIILFSSDNSEVFASVTYQIES